MRDAPLWQRSDRIGPYRIERRVGSGGMGVVYLARDPTGAAVAVKVIRPEYASHPHFRARLRREVAAARRVPRFCTAPLLDADVDADPPWVATEFIDAPTLDTALLERGRLTGAALERFAVGVAVALRAIHEHGVVHRDLKPSNILLTRLGPRVIDFGIARVEGAETQLTQQFGAMGTPAYMAPEQLRGDPATAATDVFAWASLVAYAATGRPPFGTGSGAVHGILYEDPDLGDLADPLHDLVRAAFHKDPALRPSAADLVARFSRAATATTTQVLATAAAPPAPPSTRRPDRRRPVLAGGLAVALAVSLLLPTQSTAEPNPVDDGRSRQLAAESVVAGASNHRLAMELALDAWAAGPTAEARGALLSAYAFPYDGQLGAEPGGYSVAVSPDGGLVAVGHEDGTVRLWSTDTRRPVGEPLVSHTGSVFRIAFSPDGTRLATASFDTGADGRPDGVRVWDVGRGTVVQALPGVGAVAWLPDGSGLVSIGLDEADGAVVPLLRVWDTDGWRERLRIRTDHLPFDVAVSPDGDWLASGHDNGTAAVWRSRDGARVAEVSGHDDHGVRVAFTPDGELASIGSEGDLRLTDPDGGPEPRLLTGHDPKTAGRLWSTPDGFLLSTGGGANVAVWNLAAGELTARLGGFAGTPFDVGTSADGTVVAATGTSGPTVLWRRATYWVPHPYGLTDVRFAPAGDRFATSDWEGGIRTFDRHRRRQRLEAGPASAYALAYAPDGALAGTRLDGTVQVFDRRGREVASLAVADGLEAREVAFSPDGRLLAVSASPPAFSLVEGESHRIHVWETGRWRQLAEVDLGELRPQALAFTPDGARLVAVAHAGTTALIAWRVPDLAEAARVDLGPSAYYDLEFSPDGALLALAGDRRQVELWQLDPPRPVRAFGSHPVPLRQLAFSPDGRVAATITTDESVVRLWDVATGDLLALLGDHGAGINAVTFAPDGRTLATAGADGYLALWTTDPDEAVRRICRALGPPLPPAAPHPLCR